MTVAYKRDFPSYGTQTLMVSTNDRQRSRSILFANRTAPSIDQTISVDHLDQLQNPVAILRYKLHPGFCRFIDDRDFQRGNLGPL